MTAVLFVVTGADHWTLADGTRHATGYWAEELATPHRLLREAGFDVTIATPGGVAPTVDAVSLAAESTGGKEQSDAIAAYLAAIRADLENPVKLEEVDLDAYAAVLYPGGHGPMEDLAVDAGSGRLLTAALDSGKPLAVLCHAPAALLAARREDGSWPFAGYRMTGFTNAEETAAGFADKASGCSRTAWWNWGPTSRSRPRSASTSWRTAICTPVRTPPPRRGSPGTSSTP